MIFLLIIPLICFIALFFHKLFQKEASESEAGLKLSDLLERYMFPQSKVMLSSRIGKSVYGTVYKGYAHKILSHENETLVAIKVVKGSVEDAASLHEAQKVDFAKQIPKPNGKGISIIFFFSIFLSFFSCYNPWVRN